MPDKPQPEQRLVMTGLKLPPEMLEYIDSVSAKHDNLGRSVIMRQFLKWAIKEHKANRLKLFT